MASKNLASYSEITRVGKHVIGLPWNSFKLPEENNNWFVYAAPIDIYGESTKYLTLFWVNHDTEEAVRYCDNFDHIIDPTTYPYNMHVDSTTGGRLVDARIERLAVLKK